ncbi:hypothetical protein BDB01DRAFT_845224 [Pilobolus umbonatus]|nr:hypothetical protein BDB01DRAFT_845224 [Pilobolus umbonatus]
MEVKVYRIWTILSAFEESAAGCISDMLLHVSEGSYTEGVRMADYFITQVDVLFTAIDDLANRYYSQLNERLQYDRESTMLCMKVTNFFSLLSQTQESGPRKIGITQELLSLVTGLAHFLKVLIRIGLTGTLRLEKKNDPKATAITNFLTHLITIDNKKNKYDSIDYNISSDLCQSCKQVCDEACFRYQSYIWHHACFKCSECHTPLQNEYREAYGLNDSILCKKCCNVEGYSQTVESISKLKQSSFLLRLELKRLYDTLNVQDPILTYGHPNEQYMIHQQRQQQMQQQQQLLQQNTLQPIPIPRESPRNEETTESLQINDIKQMRPTQMNRKVTNSHRIGKRSTLMETPSPNAAFVSTNPGSRRESLSTDYSNKRISQYENMLSGDNPQMTMANSHSQMYQKYNKFVSKSKSYYFAELGPLDHFMLKHIAVLYLEEILHDQFTMEELTDLIDDKKNSTLWEGTFGVPLDILVEKNGIESNLGVGPSRIIKIPAFIDESLSVMKKMDMTVEGVFRKNGNIRRLKELREEIDRNPNGIQLSNEGPIQVAALVKKFLRDLPDPLLTFRLHRLLIAAQKLESEVERKRVTHLACCLLPKVNRDTMEVLFLFMKWVAQFAHLDNNTGNKMDTANLATVIAPNILYSKSKDPLNDESYYAIQCITMLLKYPEEFATVPEDFVPLLQNLTYAESDMEMNVRQVLKKCEEVVQKNKRSGSNHSALSKQTSPVNITASIFPDTTEQTYFLNPP